MRVKENKYIDITLNSFEDVTSKFNETTLNEELSNYIFKECIGISIKNNIIIRIKPLFNMTKEQKDMLVDMIRANYGIDVSENLMHIKYENIKKLLLIILGIVFVLLSEIVDLSNVIIINEVFLIIGWVAIWEAVYSIIFVDLKRKFEIKRLKQLTRCKIEFI